MGRFGLETAQPQPVYLDKVRKSLNLEVGK